MQHRMQSVNDLLLIGMSYALDFENKVADEAKKMASAASNPDVRQIFEQSASKGREYAGRIEQVFKSLGQQVQRSDNQIAAAMISEVENMIAGSDQSAVRDAALIVAANQMQHYRVAAYGSLAHYADLLGKSSEARPLQQNLEDSKGGDEKLTRIGKEKVNPQAAAKAVAV